MKICVFSNSPRGDAVMFELRHKHEVVHVGEDQDIKAPSFWAWFAKNRFDVAICAGYPHIIGRSLLDLPKYGFWNCHAGPVPKYRGGSPLNWQIIKGEEHIGITLMQMDEGIDTGPVIATERFERGDMNINQAHGVVNTLFPKMVMEALDNIDTLTLRPQGESDDYVKQRNDEDGEIDLARMTAHDIKNFVDALSHPYPGAWIATVDGKKLRIWDVTVTD